MNTENQPTDKSIKNNEEHPKVGLIFLTAAFLFGAGYIWPLVFLGSILFVWLGTAAHFKIEKKPFLFRNFMGFLAGGMIFVLAIFIGPRSITDKQFAACNENGVKYYKEIGSYPYLTTSPNYGRPVEDVVKEMCSRSINSFN